VTAPRRANRIGTRPVFGIVQGRLLRPPAGLLQWFPQENWEMEYYMAPAMGISFIELIAERQHNEQNPMWTDAGVAAIHRHAKANGLIIPTFTNDYVIDHSILSDAETMRLSLRLISQGAKLGCTKYIFPLFEASEMTAKNASRFTGIVRETADACAAVNIALCLETVIEGPPMLDALALFDRPAIELVFDTGNRGALGHDLGRDARLLGDHIGHVHLKDKLVSGENVQLGTGVVDFAEVFRALADIDYAGLYTFETNRGEHPLRTAQFNVALAEHFHADAFGR
jgi:sugar phosphate isomerase/epimerase